MHRLLAVLLLGMTALLSAEPAAAQNIPRARLWEISLGTPVTSLPADAYLDPSCGTNGGPPSLRLASFAEFARCQPDRTTGLYEVWFSEDDEFEYIFRAARQGAARVALANNLFSHDVIYSVLVDASGLIQGYRIITDPRESDVFRLDADTVGDFLMGNYGYRNFACSDLPPAEGETPLDGRFAKRLCEATRGGEHVTIETRYFRKRGQTAVSPLGTPTEGYFESSTRLEVIAEALLNALPVPAAPVAPPVGPAAPPPASPAVATAEGRDAFLAGLTRNCPGCDLTLVSLKRRDLTGADLSGANLTDASLHRAVLRQANLSGANLTNANLNRTILVQANFSGATMTSSMLFEADASGANFSSADLSQSLMGSIRLIRANLDGALLSNSDLGDAAFTDASLAGAALDNANLYRANFIRANLSGASLTRAYLGESILRAAKLNDAVVRDSYLYAANLSDADLTNADFTLAVLTSANLAGAVTTGAVFVDAIMPNNRPNAPPPPPTLPPPPPIPGP